MNFLQLLEKFKLSIFFIRSVGANGESRKT